MPHATTLRRIRFVANLSTIMIFVALCAVPSIMLIGGHSNQISTVENRNLARLPRIPGLHKRELEAWPRQFEAFFNDHFGFRNDLLKTYRLAQVNVLGMSPGQVTAQILRDEKNTALQSGQSRVLPGRNGWLFYTGDRALENYRGTLPFNKAELKQWNQVLQERQAWLDARGIDYLLVIAPDKHSIYGEFLPRSVSVVSATRRLDQLSAQLKDTSKIQLIDLRQPLLRAKPIERLFHRTDTHWNDVGAYHGYRSIAAHLQHRFPQIGIVSADRFRKSVLHTAGGDLANMLAIAEHLPEERIKLVRKQGSAIRHTGNALFQIGSVIRKTSSHQDRPRAVVLHDSFLLAMEPFLSKSFSRVTYHWKKTAFPYQAIEQDRPDIVIQMFVERSLMTAVPKNPDKMRDSPVLWANSKRQVR